MKGLHLVLSLAAAVSVAAAQPDVDEFLIDTSIVLVPSPGDQAGSAIAFDGANFFAVWTDGRLGTDDVFGARISQTGNILDIDGIPLATGVGGQSNAAVAFDGSNFLVVYEDYRDSFQIYGIRVNPSGTVLDSTGLLITSGPRASFPAVASGTTNCLVVWQANLGDTADICGARVTRDGTVLDPHGLALTRREGDAWTPDVAFDGMNYLVVWNDDRTGYDDVYATRVTPAGAVLDPSGIPICNASNHQWSPSVAFGHGCYLVSWEDWRNGSPDLYAARVTPAGAVLDPSGIVACSEANTQWFPSVDFDGTNFLVGWGDWRENAAVFAARITPTGSVLDPDGRRISHPTQHADRPQLAFGDSNHISVWVSGSWDRDIRAARISTSCTPLDSMGFLVTATVNSQFHPAAAPSGLNYLVVWDDVRDGSADVYGARVTPEGAVLDPGGIRFSTAANDQLFPAVASDGTNSIVVWTDWRNGSDYDIYGARVSPDGTVLDPAGIPISTAPTNQYEPAVAFDGTDFLVVWEDGRSQSSWDIYGARVSREGVVLDTAGIPISTAEYWQWRPAVAYDGVGFLAVWEDMRGGLTEHDVFGARLTQAGVVLDTSGIAISTARHGQYGPAVSSDGMMWFVVWSDWRSVFSAIYGSRVAQDGTIIDSSGLLIAQASYDRYAPDLGFDGANYLVVWQDELADGWDIHGARITPEGTVFDSGPVVRQEGDQQCLALARGAGGQMLLAYQGWTGTVGAKTYDADRIWGKMDPNPGIAERPPTVFGSLPTSTIVRGSLWLAGNPSASSSPSWLLDAAGREVLGLRAGANDLRFLSPGVYFIREEKSRVQGVEGSSIHKVVIAR